METEDYTACMQYVIQHKIPNEEAAKSLGLKVRTFCRRKKAFKESGKTEFVKTGHIPYTEEEAVILFKELTFMPKSEKMVDAIERVCDKTNKKLSTERRKVNILSYPSLSFYFTKSNKIVVPIKSKVNYKGGIMLGLDQEKNELVVVSYLLEVDGEKEEMINGENDEDYLKLIEIIIEVMSKTYFKYVKDRPNESKKPIEKMECYYKKFNLYVKQNGEEDKLKGIINILMKKYNHYIFPLTFSPDTLLLSPSVDHREEDKDRNEFNSFLNSLNNSPTSNEDESDNNNDFIFPPSLLLTPSSSSSLLEPLSPFTLSLLTSPTCRSRSRSPLRF